MALATASESVVGAKKCLVEKVIETQALRCESGGDRIGAWGPSATSRYGSVHGVPQTPGRISPEARGRETTTTFSQGQRYRRHAVTKTHMQSAGATGHAQERENRKKRAGGRPPARSGAEFQ